ncbi:hypothetical protein FNU76_23745 [Chitinimonas arctica]|uniref:Protein SirB1 N-terminal domain-containing protein n=1 Tax=Chitinimonas arctica TaxID=2594795 RepID=A0A516SLV0_9NEIS|nr:transglutaminase family protein [Chitinimonas arctica]QDQ29119.1 hypothetical protein FNU76_23745 [Chitinimonas arctica]
MILKKSTRQVFIGAILSLILNSYGFAAAALLSPDVEKLFKLPEQKIDIGIAALTIAKDVYPDIDVNAYSRRIDLLAEKVKRLANGSTDPEQRIRALNTVIRNEGFSYDHSLNARGNKLNYFLNETLDAKRGTCFTLPLLYIAIGQRLGYPLYPVAAPDHMFLRYSAFPFAKQNIEATSGGKYFTDQSYIGRFRPSPRGMESGSYMSNINYHEYLGNILYVSAVAFDGDKALSRVERAAELNPKSADLQDALRLGYFAKSNHIAKSKLPNAARSAELYMKKSQQAGKKAIELGFVDPDTVKPLSGLRGE